ncbi:MAG: hypothetical protein ACQEXI_16830 [Pseudomonadota bacterium]
MAKLLLHIGTGKTGSTTLQNVLYKANKKDILGGVLYPKLLGKKHHNELCTLVMPHERVRRDIRSRYPVNGKDYLDFVYQLQSQLSADISKNENVIISGEYFSGFNDDEVADFYRKLSGLGFSEVRVVVYYREPCSLYLSQVQQRVKASSKFQNPNRYFFDYLGILRRWSNCFDDVLVRDFDRKNLHKGDLVQDFNLLMNDFFESDIDLSQVSALSENESLSPASMAFMQYYRSCFYVNNDNFFDKQTVCLVSLLQNIEEKLSYKEKPSLRHEVKKIIESNHYSQLRELKNTCGIDWNLETEGPRETLTSKRKDFRNVKSIVKFTEKDDEVFNMLPMLVVKELLDNIDK